MPDNMISPRVDDPGYWRIRAENTRKLATGMKPSDAKTILLNIAEQYEHLARLAEQRGGEAPHR
jgi:hypothetical protein